MAGCVIRWQSVDPAALPEGSPVRRALEEGRADVAAWLAETYPEGARLYVHSEATHRRAAFGGEAAEAVRSGSLSARAASRRYGVPRGALAQRSGAG